MSETLRGLCRPEPSRSFRDAGAPLNLLCILSAGAHRPSSRFRVVQHLPLLRAHGLRPEVVIAKRQGLRGLLRMLSSARRADRILIQKKLFARWKLRILARIAPLIFDMDDAYFATSPFELNSHGPRKARHRASRRAGRLAAVLRRSCRVIAGNPFLAGYAQQFARDVVVLPTAVDLSPFPSHRLNDKPDSGMTIGWIGSGPSLRYLADLRDPLARICARFKDARVVQVCDAFVDLPGVRLEFRPWSLDREADYLSGLDLGLMPLRDDPFSRGKCALKILQYFAAGAAVVCSPVGSNLDVARDRETALFASSAEEWEERIATLLQNPALRREMRERARQFVEKHYSADAVGKRLAELIHSAAPASRPTVALPAH